MYKDSEENRKLGRILKGYRKHHNVTIQEVAKELEATPEEISEYESGEQPIHIDKLKIYCKLVHTTLGQIITHVRNMKTIG